MARDESMTGKGGYDSGYAASDCFWGTTPGSLLLLLNETHQAWKNLEVLDIGCGEGKNAKFLADRGARVEAIDVSELAIRNAKRLHGEHPLIDWRIGDIRDSPPKRSFYDLVIMYGLLHCLRTVDEVLQTIAIAQDHTVHRGWNIVCCFNHRRQELEAHPGFEPILLPHDTYVHAYQGWDLISSSDADLHETHPNNGIPHVHSMTRLIAQRPY